jgi:DNA-binding protein H-NS
MRPGFSFPKLKDKGFYIMANEKQRLWIANTTKQIHEFVYRPRVGDGGVQDGVLRPKFGDLRKHTIPVGGQISVGGANGLDTGEIDNILKQHAYIVQFKDLPKVKGFQGLCYRIGPDPVPMEKIMERIDQNDDVLSEEAKDRQAATALQIAASMRNASATDDAAFKDLRETDVQVAQKGNKEVNDNTPQVNQVVEVTEEGKTPSGRGRKSAG